ncbi:hypothetical protein [Paenibacillus massiliensis]|uniref:hypothetical protein n=1 Tax=Paenibacillus massiliensis TaxID=225917 RepID=UPI00037BB0A4|nr:hypothetical protein [Paenibacillus massiliensis]
MGWEYGIKLPQVEADTTIDSNQLVDNNQHEQLIERIYEELRAEFHAAYRITYEHGEMIVWNDEYPEWPHVLNIQVDHPSTPLDIVAAGEAYILLLFHTGGKQARELKLQLEHIVARYAPTAVWWEL